MAIAHTTLINNVSTNVEASESRTFVLNFFNKLLSAYEWGKQFGSRTKFRCRKLLW